MSRRAKCPDRLVHGFDEAPRGGFGFPGDGLLDAVDARTKLAGSNKMELLLFSLGTRETFGINVFKVREVSPTPPITLTLEYGVEFIEDDELVEITPKSIRIRKRHLKESDRKRAGRLSRLQGLLNRSWLRPSGPLQGSGPFAV